MAVSYGAKRVEGVVTNNYGLDWLLFWSLDANGNTSAISRPNIVSKDFVGCNAYTYAQLTSYKNGNWSEAMFTSILYPSIRWIFTKASNPTNLPLVLQTLLYSGNPATYMTVNGEYAITLDTTKSSVAIGGSTYQFMHNWGAGEAGDIPTFGKSGGYVWSTGMYWGNIDAYSNYGGLMNRTTAQSGPSGGNTGDRLLVYVR